MKPETEMLYYKYRYFLFLISKERNDLFYKSESELDYDNFFEAYDYGISLHIEIRPFWRLYNKNRYQIIKKFEYGKYKIAIRPYFCTDIKNVIFYFMFAQMK